MNRSSAAVLCTLAASALALSSCGESATSSLTFEQFKIKLEGLKNAYRGKCPCCGGKGYWVPEYGTKERIGTKMPCDICKGTGIGEWLRFPTLQEFTAALGEPQKKQHIRGDTYFYYACKDGLIQLKVFLRDDADGSVYVVSYAPNLY